jgi:hypothetical protein
MQSPAPRRLAIVFIATIALGAFAACKKSEQPPARTEVAVVPAPAITISSTPPQDLSSRSASLDEVAQFAWQEFLALNWKSAIDPGESPVGQRGLPDNGWSYSTPGAHPELLTWQTYAQTTELRPNGPLTIPFAQLGVPQYSYLNPVPAGAGNPSFTLWNNLDEDNEIGSCDIYGQYPSQTTPRNLVLFQVKVNSDEYEYLRTNFGADQDQCASSDKNCPPANGTPTGGRLYRAQQAVIANIKNPPYEYYASQPSGPDATCDCPPDQAICLPCGGAANPAGGTFQGTIEVKSAWRKLLPADDKTRFFTTQAIYYQVDPATNQLSYFNDTFALIGLHIIHKTKNFPDFVFATFEQVDVEQANMVYAVLNGSTEQLPVVPIVRQQGQTNRTQNHPVPPTLDAVTGQVHAQLTALNKDIIWQYYRLTGVQAASVDCAPSPDTGLKNPATQCPANQNPVTCTDLDPNYFMANFVVESDPFLNNFSGPGFGANPFGNCRNTVYANGIYDNGGCKGCHGVAQTSFGTDFSFLLDFGNNKPSVSPASINNPSNDPAPALTARPPLKHYLDGVDVTMKKGDASR